MITNFGKSTLHFFVEVGSTVLLTYLSFRSAIKEQTQGLRSNIQVVATQIYFTALQALPLIFLFSICLGWVIAIQTQTEMVYMGNISHIGHFTVKVLIREVTPLCLALFVIARSGTAVATELGTMRANREFSSLESIGIDPLSYVVFPRILGGALSVLGLAFYLNVFTILFGFFFSYFLVGTTWGFYFDSIRQSLEPIDFVFFLLKNSLNGFLLFAISCKEGMRVKKSAHEIPQVTARAVVLAALSVLIFNFLVSGLYYFYSWVHLEGWL